MAAIALFMMPPIIDIYRIEVTGPAFSQARRWRRGDRRSPPCALQQRRRR
jgi:hypothetical protein